MSIVYVGIDEAGYGPMLGPMCVGAAAFRVEAGADGGAPDLFELLGSVVCRDLKSWRAAGRRPIVIGDSKKLKLPNDSKHLHPLFHLERGVLSVLRASDDAPADDVTLRSLLGSPMDSGAGAWYAGEAIGLPIGESSAEIGIAGNVLAGVMAERGAELAGLWCEVVNEAAFNEVVSRTGTKASVTAGAIAGHLRTARALWGDRGESVRVVCDRLGGRTQYAGVLRRAFGDDGRAVEVEAIEERSGRSRYRVSGDGLGTDGDWQVLFLEESEDAHLPVALASMTAKLVRELAMMRFNRYWGARAAASGIELKPTAGYVSDARRWLGEAGPMLDAGERAAMVRLS